MPLSAEHLRECPPSAVPTKPELLWLKRVVDEYRNCRDGKKILIEYIKLTGADVE